MLDISLRPSRVHICVHLYTFEHICTSYNTYFKKRYLKQSFQSLFFFFFLNFTCSLFLHQFFVVFVDKGLHTLLDRCSTTKLYPQPLPISDMLLFPMCQTYWRRYWIAPSKRKESEINSQLLIQYNACQEGCNSGMPWQLEKSTQIVSGGRRSCCRRHLSRTPKLRKWLTKNVVELAFQEEEIKYIGSESKRPCEPRADYNLSQLHMQKSALLGF